MDSWSFEKENNQTAMDFKLPGTFETKGKFETRKQLLSAGVGVLIKKKNTKHPLVP